MSSIDLNCDLGEGCGNDELLMPLISSANIACGFHAGDDDTMKRTIDLAVRHGVAIGAHPGYRDRDNFGRTDMDLTTDEIHGLVTEQIGVLQRFCSEAGAEVRHVKPHGALYNRSARDGSVAEAIARAVKTIDENLILYGLSKSQSITEAEKHGLRTAAEVFADRTYTNHGALTARSMNNALISDEDLAIDQVLDMVKYGRVRSTGGVMVKISAQTICIHGDGGHAVKFAAMTRKALEAHGFLVQAP